MTQTQVFKWIGEENVLYVPIGKDIEGTCIQGYPPTKNRPTDAMKDAHKLLCFFLWSLENSLGQTVQLDDPPEDNLVAVPATFAPGWLRTKPTRGQMQPGKPGGRSLHHCLTTPKRVGSDIASRPPPRKKGTKGSTQDNDNARKSKTARHNSTRGFLEEKDSAPNLRFSPPNPSQGKAT
jgi:hypothetical protein